MIISMMIQCSELNETSYLSTYRSSTIAMRMRLYTFLHFLLFISPVLGASQPVDVLMVVQGSSITDNARLDIVKTAVDTLANGMDSNSRLGLLEFNANTSQLSPLEPVTEERKQSLLTTILLASQREDRTLNSATALEYAIYKLRTEGGPQAVKTIIMIGDGISVDAGQHNQDALTQWIKTELSDEASNAGIRIYWMTLTESADYRSIQGVTQKTMGQYFRTFNTEQARNNIVAILSTINRLTRITDMEPGAAASSTESQSAFTKPKEYLSNNLIGSLVAVLAVGGIFALVITRIGSRKRRTMSATAEISHTRRAEDQRVTLRDMSEFTAMTEYDITDHRTYIGRLPREVTERSCVIVIRDTTVGRNHATIEHRDGGYWLTDQGTVNGTYINGNRLQGAKRLSSGDRIRFARFEFKINIPATLAAMDTNSGTSPVDKRGDSETITDRDDDRTVFRSKI